MESHAAELTRAISELSLQSIVPRAVVQDPSSHSPSKHLHLRSSANEHEENSPPQQVSNVGSGVATPAEIPRAPPPTPESSVKPFSTTQVPRASPLNPNKGNQAPENTGSGTKQDEALEIPKKKKKKKSSGKNKKPAPTGFEEFYADPPITPDEHQEECEVYSGGRPFYARMQTCIQRYRARRKLDEFRAKVFTKYLMLGGVEASTTKQFNGGLDQDTLDNSTSVDIAAIQATDYIRGGSSKYYDPHSADVEGWVVDFEGVAKGFFSYRVSNAFPLDSYDEIKAICATVRNFLNYILTHAVCPEYTSDVLNARKICDRAEKELWAIKRVRVTIPGRFNAAASELYCADETQVYWTYDDLEMKTVPKIQVMTPKEAKHVFINGLELGVAGYDHLSLATLDTCVRIVKTETKALELVEIVRPDLRKINEWAALKDHNGVVGGMQPLGLAKFKQWEGPELTEEDMTDDGNEGEPQPADTSDIEAFLLEESTLCNIFIGMKVEVKISELNNGFRFIESLVGIYCSFFTYLPQEKIALWRDPVLNTGRPAPTEDDPDVEDQTMNNAMNDEFS